MEIKEMIQQLKDVAEELGFEEDVPSIYISRNNVYEIHINDTSIVLYNMLSSDMIMLDLDRVNLTIEDHINKLKKFIK